MARTCSKCNKQFPPDQMSKSGSGGYCKPCRRQVANLSYRRNKHREEPKQKRRAHMLMKLYGITPTQYDTLLMEQGSRCAVCRVDTCPSGRTFSVDHCHETGVVRGLLCSLCNTAIGLTGDNPSTLRALADYLEVSHGKNKAA